jgi:hypothetical protein
MYPSRTSAIIQKQTCALLIIWDSNCRLGYILSCRLWPLQVLHWTSIVLSPGKWWLPLSTWSVHLFLHNTLSDLFNAGATRHFAKFTLFLFFDFPLWCHFCSRQLLHLGNCIIGSWTVNILLRTFTVIEKRLVHFLTSCLCPGWIGCEEKMKERIELQRRHRM